MNPPPPQKLNCAAASRAFFPDQEERRGFVAGWRGRLKWALQSIDNQDTSAVPFFVPFLIFYSFDCNYSALLIKTIGNGRLFRRMTKLFSIRRVQYQTPAVLTRSRGDSRL